MTNRPRVPRIVRPESLDYVPGPRGLSAYDLAKRAGYPGTEDEWLEALKGPAGPQGLSAYQVAVANGYQGTEAEWLLTLGRPDGEAQKFVERLIQRHLALHKQVGPQGPVGPAGPPGPEGPMGPMGPMPAHRWVGTQLQFQIDPDTWGPLVDLKGPPGTVNLAGGVPSSEGGIDFDTITELPSFPNNTELLGWDGSAYKKATLENIVGNLAADISTTGHIIAGPGNEYTVTVNGATLESTISAHAEGATDIAELAIHRHSNTGAFGAHVVGVRSRGDETTETVVQSGDNLLRLVGLGYDGTDYAIAAQIEMAVDGATGNNDIPGRIVFSTASDGAQTATERMRIDSAGTVSVQEALEVGPVTGDYTTNFCGSFNVDACDGQTGPGTVSVSAGTTVTGVGTEFTAWLSAGDAINITTTSGAEVRYVSSIASDTSLTVSSAFAGSASGVAYTVTNAQTGYSFRVLPNGNIRLHNTANQLSSSTQAHFDYSPSITYQAPKSARPFRLGPTVAFTASGSNSVIGNTVNLTLGSANAQNLSTMAAQSNSVVVQNGATGTLSQVTCTFTQAIINAAGTSTQGQNFYGQMSQANSSPISDWCGIKIGPMFSAPAPANSALCLLGTLTTPSGNWGLYIAENVPSYLAGSLQVGASSTARASLNIPHGTAPTAPADGDLWTTSAGAFVQINTSTKTVGMLETANTWTAAQTINAQLSVASSLGFNTSFSGCTVEVIGRGDLGYGVVGTDTDHDLLLRRNNVEVARLINGMLTATSLRAGSSATDYIEITGSTGCANIAGAGASSVVHVDVVPKGTGARLRVLGKQIICGVSGTEPTATVLSNSANSIYAAGFNPGFVQEIHGTTGGFSTSLFKVYANKTSATGHGLMGGVGVVGSFGTNGVASTPVCTYMYFGTETTFEWNDNTMRLYPDKKTTFAGNVGVGASAHTTPANPLSVTGNGTFTGSVRIGSASTPTVPLEVTGVIRSTTNIQANNNTAAQTSALVVARGASNGNSYEFGHANQAGYGSVIGHMTSSGAPFIGFNCEHGTNSSTLRTRGRYAGYVMGQAATVEIGTAASNNADNQTPVALFQVQLIGGDAEVVTGNLCVLTAGKGLAIKEGTNARMGTATLVAGTVTVSTTAVAANSRIFLTTNTPGGTVGTPYVSARSAGTSFTITSTSGTDTSTVAWFIVNPA